MDDTTPNPDPTDGDADLQALRSLGQDIGQDPGEWLEPPAGLWERIASEAGVAIRDERAGGQGSRRSFGAALPWMLTLAAVLALVALTVGVLLRTTPDNDLDDATLLAQAPLELLGDVGSGNAELLDADGTLHLRLETADLEPGDGFLELWVIDLDVTKLVSLGPLRTDGVYELPPGLDPVAFPVVDVSIEPIDGDPTHSGNSVLRGILDF